MEAAGQYALILAGIKLEQFFGNDETKDTVAEKFQPLVGMNRVGAGMGKRALEQRAIGKIMSEFFGEPSQISRSAAESGNSGWRKAISTLPRNGRCHRWRRS